MTRADDCEILVLTVVSSVTFSRISSCGTCRVKKDEKSNRNRLTLACSTSCLVPVIVTLPVAPAPCDFSLEQTTLAPVVLVMSFRLSPPRPATNVSTHSERSSSLIGWESETRFSRTQRASRTWSSEPCSWKQTVVLQPGPPGSG
ncbi:hypothetical protein EYF80_039205 [Liparis tanakae]|uniref:Uncharacterized protein n=1 Tax=Liparis tanakae TaxID=230148 RepID=A0A4Z2GBV1_9TELE|nr:hypothetical protein EYF80_039205 [Liparis tanakae]